MQKTAVVTGGAGNLGQVVIKKLLDHDYKVVATKLPDEKFTNLHGAQDFDSETLDLTDENACENFVNKVVKNNSTIDVAALLAGGFGMGNIENSTLGDIHRMFKINFETAYASARAIFRQMANQKGGGHIIMISGKPALTPEAGKDTLGYALSKSLILRLAEILNVEGKDKNIKASVIVPSILDTPPNREAMPNANFENWVKPEEIADAIAYISSDRAKSFRETVLKIYANS